MSDTNSDQQEPSIEDILASIRQIISEDGNESLDQKGAAPPSEKEESSAELVDRSSEASEEVRVGGVSDDILVLTDVIDEQEPVTGSSPEVKPHENIGLGDEKLISDGVERISAATMSGLTTALATDPAVGDGSKTLEQLVKDVLQPILKQWLEENLPEIVDRIVREEVERIAARVK
ncbi:MAG: hypothetical protein CL573_04165 [Alphaproteobacteria bacterium]|nr:hypothetical protein [Alphaproteobacteria bacterium]